MTETDIALPPKVATAVAAVMNEVPKLKKGEKNSHGNYNFASIDDFLEAVRPLCAKHGLIISQDEEAFDHADGWLTMKFRFTLAHSSGETWAHRPTRTIMVSSKMGSQAFGAAQSYALKQYMRSLFQIATGEKGQDADEHPAADLPAKKRTKAAPTPTAAQNGNGPQEPGTWQGPKGKFSAFKQEIRELVHQMEGCSDDGELAGLLKTSAETIKNCRDWLPTWYDGYTDGNGQYHEGLGERITRIQQRLRESGGQRESELTEMDAG